MRSNFIASAALALVLIANFPAAARAESADVLHATLAEKGATPEISTAEMRRITADKSALVLDTRTRAEFDAGHLPGAVNVQSPAAQFPEEIARLAGDRNRLLVLYCNGPYCQASQRIAEQLSKAGFSNVRRYQLGLPVWRAPGGPVQVEASGIARVFAGDRTAVFVDVRSQPDFAKGSLAGAINAPAEDLASGKLAKIALPEDDFNRRVVIFGKEGTDALQVAIMMSTRPWHNVMYFAGTYEEMMSAAR